MPLPIAWNADLEVEVQSLDDEHRLLLDHATVLDNALIAGESEDEVGLKIAALLEYTKSHFESEERLMTSANYAGYRKHKADHDALLAQLEILQRELRPGNFIARAHLVRAFIEAWCKNHMSRADRHFAKFLKNPGASSKRRRCAA